MQITKRGASKAYLEMVDNSYLGTSDEVCFIRNRCLSSKGFSTFSIFDNVLFLKVNKLIERLEATFIKYFANGNRRKGMKSLKPGHKREKHRTTFFLGKLDISRCFDSLRE